MNQPDHGEIKFIDETDLSCIPELELAGWKGTGWYFWNEDWTRVRGPFSQEEQAHRAWSVYRYEREDKEVAGGL